MGGGAPALWHLLTPRHPESRGAALSRGSAGHSSVALGSWCDAALRGGGKGRLQAALSSGPEPGGPCRGAEPHSDAHTRRGSHRSEEAGCSFRGHRRPNCIRLDQPSPCLGRPLVPWHLLARRPGGRGRLSSPRTAGEEAGSADSRLVFPGGDLSRHKGAHKRNRDLGPSHPPCHKGDAPAGASVAFAF